MRYSLRGRILAAASLILAAVLLAGLVLLLEHLGLERADQLASVLALFVGLVGLAVTVLLTRPDRPSEKPTSKRRRQRTAWGRRLLRDDVRELLKTTQSVSNRSPNGLLGDRVNEVSVVYVQQRVEQPQAPGTTAADRRLRRARLTGDAIFLPFDRRPKVIPVRRSLDHIFGQHRHLLIEGGPGTGKSTTAAQICRQLASSWLDATPDGARLSPTPVLPLLVTARALAEVASEPWKVALATAAFRGLRLSGSETVDPALLAGPVDGAEWLIVVDGLDEVPSKEREKFLGDLSRWTTTADEPYRLLITTRPLAAHATSMLGTGPIGHYTLLPFDRQMLSEFALLWFSGTENGPELATGFLTQVSSAGLHDVTSVPLMATIAITVYQEDPHTRLPRNRHDLYEQYLRVMGRRDGERRIAARAVLVDDLKDEPNRAKVVSALFDRADELLAEVAVARVDGSRNLTLVGLEWLSRETGLATGLSRYGWGGRVEAALVGTGLLTHRDTGPDFIHLTFAEHFAARRHAAALPETFDAQHAGWMHWVHRARRGDPVGLAVLTRWAHSHEQSGAALLGWLLAAPSDYRFTAVRLVAEGAPATGAHLAACLDTVDQRLWQAYSDAEEAVSPVRRFPDTPYVVQWLSRQLDRAQPGSAGWAVLAAVLADRDRTLRADLVARLLAATTEGALGSRLAAAKALGEVALEQRSAAASALTQALATGGGSISDRVAVASHLLEFEGRPRTTASHVLEDVLRDESATVNARQTAAEALAEWDGDARQVILAELRKALTAPGYGDHGRHSIAKAMIAVAPECRAEVAEWLTRFTERPDLNVTAYTALLRTLADLGPEHRITSVRRLKECADDLTQAVQNQNLLVAARLAEIGEEFWDDAISITSRELRCLGPEPSSGRYQLQHFRDLDRRLQERLVAAVMETAEEPDTPPGLARRIRAATVELTPAFQNEADALMVEHSGTSATLLELPAVVGRIAEGSPGHASEAGTMALGLLGDDRADLPCDTTVGCCRNLLNASADRALHAMTTMFALIADPAVPAEHRESAAFELVGRAEYRETAARILMGPEHALRDFSNWRSSTFRQLGQTTSYRREAITGLRTSLDDTLLQTADRLESATILTEWEPDRKPEITDRLRDMLDERTNGSQDIVSIAGTLLGITKDDVAHDRLMSLARDIHAPGGARVDAIERLISPGQALTEQHQTILGSVAADRYAFAADRLMAIRTLRNSGVDVSAETADLPSDVATSGMYLQYSQNCELFIKIYNRRGDPVVAVVLQQYLTSYWSRFGGNALIGRMLARLPFYREAVRAALREPLPTIMSIAVAVRVLPWEHAAVEAAIGRILDAPGTTAPTRERALEIQLLLTPQHRHSAVDRLTDVMKAPAFHGPDDTLTAAKLLYQVTAHRAVAGDFLAAVVADETEARSRRWTARSVLSRDGGPRARRLVAASFAEDLRDPRLPIDIRCQAAVEGAKVAPDTVAEIQDRLRRLAPGHPKPEAIHSALLEIDPSDGVALANLIAVMSDPATTHRLVVAIATSLVKGRPPHQLACGVALESMLRTPRPTSQRVALLSLLKDALPGTLPAVTGELVSIATDAGTPVAVRIRAASALCDADSGPVGRMGVEALLPIFHDPHVDACHRVAAGRVLLETIGPHRTAVRDRMLVLNRLDATAAVLHHDGDPMPFVLPDTPEPVFEQIHDLLKEPDAPAHVLIAAARELGGIDDPAQQAVAAATMRRIGEDGTVHPYLRAVALAGAQCAARLREILEDADAPLDHRRWAGEALADLDERERKPVRDTLRTLDGEHLGARTRRRLQRSITYADTGQRRLT